MILSYPLSAISYQLFRIKSVVVSVLMVVVITTVGCDPPRQVNSRLDSEMPKKIIWAWERPEDLRFLDPKEYGVAFLAQTIFLEKDNVSPKPRRQPLEISPGTYLIAVTRIETNKNGGERPAFDQAMIDKTVSLIRSTLDLPDVKGIQIDFDAVVSEREFYRQVMLKLRQSQGEHADGGVRVPLTMTALASWCTGDAWFNDFPVDEAVPMVFQMGADDEKIKAFLRNGNDWRDPLCRGSYGISRDDAVNEGIKPGRRTYFFSNEAWKPSDF